MSFIEGVGDEVTGFAVITLIGILVGTLSYISSSLFTNSPTVVPLAPVFEPQVTAPQPQVNVAEDTHREDTSAESQSQNQNNNEQEFVEEIGAASLVENGLYFPRENTSDESSISEDNETVRDTDRTLNSDASNVPNNVASAPPSEFTETVHSNEIRVRLKYLDDTDRTVLTDPTVNIGDFKQIHFPAEVAANKMIRLIYNGQLLRDNTTLQFSGINDNCVVHVHISSAPQPQNTSSMSQNMELELGHLLWPLLSAILGVFWVLYFKYPDFFSVMSLGILFLFTGTFIFVYTQLQNR